MEKINENYDVKGKFVTSSEVKKFQNPSCHILEKINENYDKKYIIGYDDALKDLWGTKVMYCYVVKWPVLRLQRGSVKSPLGPSVLDLYGLTNDNMFCSLSK